MLFNVTTSLIYSIQLWHCTLKCWVNFSPSSSWKLAVFLGFSRTSLGKFTYSQNLHGYIQAQDGKRTPNVILTKHFELHTYIFKYIPAIQQIILVKKLNIKICMHFWNEFSGNKFLESKMVVLSKVQTGRQKCVVRTIYYLHPFV